MIDETQGIINLTKEEVLMIQERFGINNDSEHYTIKLKEIPGITATFLYGGKHRMYLFNDEKQSWFIDIKVGWIELMNKNNLDEVDINEGYLKVNKFLSSFCHATYKDILLESIEYNRDVYVDNYKDRENILTMFHNSINKSYHLDKDITYKTSVYHLNASQKKKVYDKNCERKASGCIPKYYEVDAIRFEAVIKKNHFYYRYHHGGTLMTLDNYLTKDMYLKYMRPFANDIYFDADYHNASQAKEIINSAEAIKKKDKAALHKFMADVSEKGLLSVKKHLGYYRYRKDIILLRQINVNPILIDDDMGVSYLQTPIRGIII